MDGMRYGTRNEHAAMGYETSTGVPYHYGVWKPLKGDYRFITGTSANTNEGAAKDGRRQKRTDPCKGNL